MNTTPTLFDNEPVRYFRNCNAETYCELRGQQVLYFGPHVRPEGVDSSDTITRDVVLKYAAKQPHLDGEITRQDVDEIRAKWEVRP